MNFPRRLLPALVCLGLGVLSALSVHADAPVTPPPALPQLTVHGEDFVDASGKPVRFWGVNVVALIPTTPRRMRWRRIWPRCKSTWCVRTTSCATVWIGIRR